MVKRLLLSAALVGALSFAGGLGGCQSAAVTPATQPVFTNEIDRGFSQLLGPKFDLKLADGTMLYGCTFYGVFKQNDKDFIHIKDFMGLDFMVRYEHIILIKR